MPAKNAPLQTRSTARRRLRPAALGAGAAASSVLRLARASHGSLPAAAELDNWASRAASLQDIQWPAAPAAADEPLFTLLQPSQGVRCLSRKELLS